MPARVGIIGGGNVGQTLGRQLVKKGRSVVFGSRNPTKLQQDLTDKGLGAAEALPIADAVSRSDVVLLAVPGEWSAAPAGLGSTRGDTELVHTLLIGSNSMPATSAAVTFEGVRC